MCVKGENFKEIETTTWIGKHIPISVSISSDVTQNPIFLCSPNPPDWLSSINDALEILATKSEAQKTRNFLQVETAIKYKIACVLETLNQRRSHRVDFKAEDDNSGKSSAQFLQREKSQLIDLPGKFHRYCKTIPIFLFTSARYDINLIKSHLLPNLVSERDIELIVIKKANHLVSFKFDIVQFLDYLNFFGGATFLRVHKTSGMKSFFS